MQKKNRAFYAAVAAGLALCWFAPVHAAPVVGFNDDFEVSKWAVVKQGDGEFDGTGAPVSIRLTGANDGGGEQNVDVTIESPGNGVVSFSWSYMTDDFESPFFDPFGYLLNDVFKMLILTGASEQQGVASFKVRSGDVFGFRQASSDSTGGAASTLISNFSFTPTVSTVPEPGSLALLGLGLAGLGLMRRRRA